MSLSFNPATDIYAESDYAQQVVNQYQGNQYYVPGFNGSDSPLEFAQNFGRGYYRFADNRSGMTAMGATAAALATGRTAIPFNRRNLGHNLDVYENSRAYSQGRMRQLQQAAFERANRMARNIAVQRNRFYGQDQQERLAGLFDNAATSVLLSSAQALMPPEYFEAMFGRAGSGMGMYDAAYSQSTYRLKEDGSRWSPGERLRYASQATSMFYLDPNERRRRLFNSVEGGRLWSNLEAMGLLGANEADYPDRAPEETVRSAISYFVDTDVSPYASDRTRELHEKVQKRQAINDRRRELAELQDMINSPLDDDQKLEAIREFRQKSSELLRLEKDSGITPHSQQGDMPADFSKATAAMQDLQAHYHRRASFGRDQDGFDKETERLALIAQQEIIDANLGTAAGHSIDLADLGDDRTRQRIVSSLERAEGSRERYVQAERQAVSPLTERDIDAGAERYIRMAADRFSEIVNDPDRDVGMENSRKWDDLLLKAQKVFEIQARKGSAEEVEEAKRKALEAAGGDAVGELVLRMADRKLLGQSLDLRGDDPETREIVRRSLRTERNMSAESARLKIDEELLRGGFKSRDIDRIDLSDLPLDEIVSFSEAIIAAQDDPRLAQWLKNSASINSKKGRWAEYEKALKALQEAITDKNASPAKLLETLNQFAGGNLHQMDVTQLKRTVQQTYALARQLGQGDEYVEASMGQSQQMLAALGVNRAFTGWHGMQGLAHKAATLENPEYLGVWGAQTTAETTAAVDSHRAAWLRSNVANQWGAALNVRRTYGDFREGSSAENYMKALERGDSTFERVYFDEQGNRRTEQWSVQMSETQWRQIIPESLDTDDPERIKAARSSMGAVLTNRSANQKVIHDNPDLAAVVQHAHSAAQFTTGVAMASRASTARGFVNQKAAELAEQQGITATSRGRIMQQVYLDMADRMLDADEVQRIVRDYGIDRDDSYFIGKIGAVMQQEEFQRIVQMGDTDSDEYKVAQNYLKLMENEKDRDEMAVPIQHLLDEIGLNTGHQNAVNAMKNLSRKVAGRQRVHVAVAEEEQLMKDSLMEGFSQTVLTRVADALGEGASPTEIANAAFQLIDLNPESDLMLAFEDVKQAGAKKRQLVVERNKIMQNRDLPDEERERLLEKNDARMKTAVQNLGDAQATLQPELRKMRLGFEKMSTAEFDARFGMDLDTLNQVVTVQDRTTGRFKLRKLERDEVRINAETGIMQVREGLNWVDKQDAAYFAQMTRKGEQGEEEHYFKELFRENGRWKYLDDDGSFIEFDPNADGAKMAIGTKILTRAQDGSVKASNYQWTNGFLTKTAGDGQATHVVTDSEGNYIAMDSEIGKAIYSSSEDGFLNQELIEAIEHNRSDFVTVLSSDDLKRGTSARRLAAMAADENKVSIHERKIRDLANQYVDSTGAIGEIDPVKIEMEGETFYMLTGYGSEESRTRELERYRAEQVRQNAEIKEYFEAGDSEAKRFLQNDNEELRKARKAYRINKTTQERLQGRIEANREKLAAPQSEEMARRIRDEIAKDERTLALLEPVGIETIRQAAKEQARLVRVDEQSEEVRQIGETAISTVIDDPNLLDAVYRYGGTAVKGRNKTETQQRFTAVELSDIIGSMKETAKPLPATEQGRMDVYIEELVRKKEEAQKKADRILAETFNEQGASGVKIIEGKTADPVKKDRFGNPVVITPIPRKDLLTSEKKTEPTDIRQLRIGSGTYDAVTGTELNIPVRSVEKAAIEIPLSVPVPFKESPVRQADPSLSTSVAKESPDIWKPIPDSESAVTVDPLEYPGQDRPPTPKETPDIVSEPTPVIRKEEVAVPQVVSPPTEQIEQSTQSSVAPIVFRERQTPSTGLENLFVETSAPEPAKPVNQESANTLASRPEPKAVPPGAGSSPSVSGKVESPSVSRPTSVTEPDPETVLKMSERIKTIERTVRKDHTLSTEIESLEETAKRPPPHATGPTDELADVPAELRKRAVRTIDSLEEQRPIALIDPDLPTEANEPESVGRHVGFPVHDGPIRKKGGFLAESVKSDRMPDLHIEENVEETAIGILEEVNAAVAKSVENRLDPPAVVRTAIASMPASNGFGQGNAAGDCTLHADTVHFNVASMDMKNGSVVVEAVGRGNRNGTSEQR